ncbi:KH domain-containing protein akap-1 [Athalia rosae]|uniref:KH domain-containing protein akap-1 n=1 Tax=Athalia rosae TaxID=37344 RepID=UPI002033357D|nr:KH domain-containing protein akap-1 [Athalia rosae]XP_012251573.2 KH domain-containing protein akap-1 [Athalia rosae]
MLSPQIQLVKWTVPAFALILGLLWYKRRRADRADPGGKSDSKANCHSIKTSASQNPNDSGFHFDDSFASSSSIPMRVEVACSPRQVSESLDIPQRKPAVNLSVTPITSLASSGPDAWYKDVEMTAEIEEVVDSQKPIVQEPPVVKQISLPKSKSKSPYETARTSVKNQISKMLDHSEETAKPEAIIHEIKIQDRAGSERDSANHSPVSGVLDGSVSDEASSEGSSDSGKGGSIKGNGQTVYEFVLPQSLIGRLIGRHGVFLHSVKSKGQVNILIKRHPETNKMKVCAIEGSQKGIHTALEMIRQKFPENKYPSVTLEQVTFLQKPEETPWVPEVMQLKLVEGLNNDVTVINVMEPNHLFLHLPTHPSYPSLRILDQNMTLLYNTAADAPSIPDQLEKGMIFVGKWYDRWVRVYIQKPDPQGEKNLVRLIDHGGFWYFKNSEMRKIRYDYLTLPFQAIEVFLANIQPKNGTWVPEAYSLVCQITQGIVVQAQIHSYVDRDTHVNLYLNIQKHGVISLADELVARGYAERVQLEEM